MRQITTIGLDIAKSVFQVHGIDAEGNVILRRQLKRRYVLAFFQNEKLVAMGRQRILFSVSYSRGTKYGPHRKLRSPFHVVEKARLMSPDHRRECTYLI
jgi:transposase